jgi:hypothetical protein
MSGNEAIRPADDSPTLVGQLVRELRTIANGMDLEEHRDRWQDYALQLVIKLQDACLHRHWNVAEQVAVELKAQPVTELLEDLGNRSRQRAAEVRIGMEAYLQVIELMCENLNRYHACLWLASDSGRDCRETLKSICAEPQRWLTVDEVAERNRYGHVTMSQCKLQHTLDFLEERGLVMRRQSKTLCFGYEVGVRIVFAPTKAGQKFLVEMGEAE